MKKIVCVHLYNDFSGSPLVLSTAIKGLVEKGNKVTLLTSESEGFLSDLRVEKVVIPYRFHSNKLIRLFLLLLNQLIVFVQILKYRKEEVVIYVNTLLPFGAALAGKLIGKKVVYHVHETSVRPLILKKFLKYVASITASKAIYVSKYLMETEKIQKTEGKVIHNTLSKGFIKKANDFIELRKEKSYPFTVLMLCSLKKYKGVDQFVELAKSLPQYRFELVLNADSEAINEYFDFPNLPKNIVLFPKQSDVHWFYERAHLVVNLSDPNQWIETFGMTLLEAMTYGVPVIAPPIGGPTEIVKNGLNGFTIALQQLPKIVDSIKALAQNPTFYEELSLNAINSANLFKETNFRNAFYGVMKS